MTAETLSVDSLERLDLGVPQGADELLAGDPATQPIHARSLRRDQTPARCWAGRVQTGSFDPCIAANSFDGQIRT